MKKMRSIERHESGVVLNEQELWNMPSEHLSKQ